MDAKTALSLIEKSLVGTIRRESAFRSLTTYEQSIIEVVSLATNAATLQAQLKAAGDKFDAERKMAIAFREDCVKAEEQLKAAGDTVAEAKLHNETMDIAIRGALNCDDGKPCKLCCERMEKSLTPQTGD